MALDPTNLPGEAYPRSPSAPSVSGRAWLAVLAAGLLAGVLAWAFGEPFHKIFQAPLRRVVTMGYESMRATPGDTRAANIKNATLAYLILAVTVPVAIGIAAGWSRRSTLEGLVGGIKGAILGIVATCLLSIPSQLAYWRYFGDDAENEELFVPLLAHVVSWVGIGLGGGSALAFGLKADRAGLIRALVGGAFGAVLGTALFEFIGAAVFPLDKTTFPLSASVGSRFLARLLVAVGTSAFALKLAAAHGRKVDLPIDQADLAPDA